MGGHLFFPFPFFGPFSAKISVNQLWTAQTKPTQADTYRGEQAYYGASLSGRVVAGNRRQKKLET